MGLRSWVIPLFALTCKSQKGKLINGIRIEGNIPSAVEDVLMKVILHTPVPAITITRVPVWGQHMLPIGAILKSTPKSEGHISAVHTRVWMGTNRITLCSCVFLFLQNFMWLQGGALRAGQALLLSYRPHFEVRDPIWGDDWSQSLHRRSPSWGFPGFSSAVRQMPGDLCTARDHLIIIHFFWHKFLL